MKTSQDVLEAGLYSSECCGSEKFFDDNDVFERCPHCMSLCKWEFLDGVNARDRQEREIA